MNEVSNQSNPLSAILIAYSRQYQAANNHTCEVQWSESCKRLFAITLQPILTHPILQSPYWFVINFMFDVQNRRWTCHQIRAKVCVLTLIPICPFVCLHIKMLASVIRHEFVESHWVGSKTTNDHRWSLDNTYQLLVISIPTQLIQGLIYVFNNIIMTLILRRILLGGILSLIMILDILRVDYNHLDKAIIFHLGARPSWSIIRREHTIDFGFDNLNFRCWFWFVQVIQRTTLRKNIINFPL